MVVVMMVMIMVMMMQDWNKMMPLLFLTNDSVVGKPKNPQ